VSAEDCIGTMPAMAMSQETIDKAVRYLIRTGNADVMPQLGLTDTALMPGHCPSCTKAYTGGRDYCMRNLCPAVAARREANRRLSRKHRKKNYDQ